MSLTPDTDAGWASISDLATLKGVTKQTLGERVSRLEAQGRLTTRPGRNRSKLVNVAEYDRAVGETTDLAHVSGAATKRLLDVDDAPAPAAADPLAPVYTREQARLAAYKADLAQLDLDERLGKLVAVDDLARAAGNVAEACVRQIDRIALRADEVAAAVAKDGVQGARAVLKTIARSLREAVGASLSDLAKSPDAAMPAEPDDDAPAGADA